jgi:SecD/SecF fusion protein
MSRASLWRALLALIILVTTGYFAFTQEPRLGLDLRGGTTFTLETRDSPTTQANAESTDRTLEVLRRRVDALGVAEPTLARSGETRILVELPDVTDPAAARDTIGRTAQLTIHPVLGPGDPSVFPGAPTEPTGAPAPVPSGAVEPSPGAEQPVPAEPPASGQPSSPAALGRSDPALSVQPATFTGTQPTPAPGAQPTPQPSGEPGVEAEPPPRAERFDPSKPQQTLLDDRGLPILIGPPALTGEGIGGAGVGVDPQTGIGRFVTIDFRGEGGRRWEELTAAAACNPITDDKRRVAIVLDGEVISSPPVAESVACGIGIVGGSTQITGAFTQEEAQDLAVLIEGGALPVPVEIIAESVVGPTLGADAIDASTKAGIIGLTLTALFLIFIYRLTGLLAALALASYGVISYGTLVALGATLTLPGLAGLLLSAGLAIDANVLVFERAKEEFAGQRTRRLAAALRNGYRNAFSAIADSNITTLLAAGLLFFLATGPVRGFGVTLVIGVLASLVSALLITRVLTDVMAALGPAQRRPAVTGLARLGRVREWLTAKNPDLMRYRKRWLAISGIALVLASAGIAVRGLNFGVEFTGGRLAEYSSARTIEVGAARNAVSEAGFPDAVVQRSGQDDLTVRTPRISDEEADRIESRLAALGGDIDRIRDEQVGPSLGSELRTKALIALGVALLAQLIYISIRFRWTFAAGTVLAMLHDLLIVVGIFAWLGKPIDGVFLAAALTIIGVSVNDSIVTLDRVRELWSQNRTKPLPGVTNAALLQTAPRTINTGLGAMFILAALTFLGGSSLTDFALALLLGLIIGTYSSAFTASPLMLLFEQRNSAPPPMPKRKVPASAERRPAQKRKPAPRPARVSREGGAVI